MNPHGDAEDVLQGDGDRGDNGDGGHNGGVEDEEDSPPQASPHLGEDVGEESGDEGRNGVRVPYVPARSAAQWRNGLDELEELKMNADSLERGMVEFNDWIKNSMDCLDQMSNQYGALFSICKTVYDKLHCFGDNSDVNNRMTDRERRLLNQITDLQEQKKTLRDQNSSLEERLFQLRQYKDTELETPVIGLRSAPAIIDDNLGKRPQRKKRVLRPEDLESDSDGNSENQPQVRAQLHQSYFSRPPPAAPAESARTVTIPRPFSADNIPLRKPNNAARLNDAQVLY